MLEEVREAGPAGHLVFAADVVPDVDLDERDGVILSEDDIEPVWKLVLLEWNCRSRLLCERSGQEDEAGEGHLFTLGVSWKGGVSAQGAGRTSTERGTPASARCVSLFVKSLSQWLTIVGGWSDNHLPMIPPRLLCLSVAVGLAGCDSLSPSATGQWSSRMPSVH